jgi:transcriptional regulator with XRE-family HTH domain
MQHLEDYLTVGIGSTLRRLRTEKGFTQKELAAKVAGGLDYTYIGKIEREEQLPSLKILIKLSEALAIPLSSFFREEGEQPASLPRPEKVTDLAIAREKSNLLKELNQLHSRDIPLMIEIVRALNKHRKLESTSDYCLSGENLQLVAEKKPDYDKGK